MNGGVTTSRSLLDKPLNEITEEDISQLTREDCRTYLKEKGMRRPSWNKSQAIQQVICLKSLFETSTDSSAAAGAPRKISGSPPENPPLVTWNSVKEQSANVAYRREDPPRSIPSVELACGPHLIDTDNKAISPRGVGATNWSVGQMTIFYCGKVNVYDGVPADKARAIMHLAASPIHFPQDNPSGRTAALWSSPCHLQTASVKLGFIPSDGMISQTMQTDKMTEYPQQFREEGNASREPDVEGQTNRQVSLQRYLEKRKDRFKSRKKTVFSSSSLEMYLNHQMRTQTSNGQSSRSSTSSPPQPGPHTLCSSAENQAKNASLSVDLNDRVIQEN